MKIIEKTKSEEGQAFEILFCEYYSRLCAFVFKLTQNYSASEDIVQELFIKLWIQRGELEITENVSLKQSKEISENRNSTTKKKRSYKEEMEYNALPDKIEQLEAEIEKLQIELTDASVYTNPEKLIKIQTELAEKESLLLKFYERYEELDSIGT